MSDTPGRDEPRWLTEPMLMMIHARQVERYGGAHGVRDPDAILSALARARNLWAYDEEADLADLAASYLVGFTRSQGFVDGNKRTGLATALVFLSLNGHALHVPGEELLALTMQVANNEADDEVVSAYLRSRMEEK